MKTSRTCAAIASVLAFACGNSSTDELGTGARTTQHASGVVDEQAPAASDTTTGSTKSGDGASKGVVGATGDGTGGGSGTGGGTGTGTGASTTSVLNTFSKIWINGDAMGPNKIGKNTGAGTMDAHFDYAVQADGSVLLATLFTRSANTPNNNNSYMQGGFAVAKLTSTGVDLTAPMVELPVLQGERAFMRPQPLAVKTASGVTKWLLIAASEDNGVNNNPQPVAFLADADGKLLAITNNTRGNQINKPTNLIQQALKDGVTVQNPNNQRGPHSYAKVTDNSYIIGMQYNNQAAEGFRVTVGEDNSVNINWLNRYSNNAQHCRPQVALGENGTAYISSVEANTQPADIGARLTAFNVDTGKATTSKIILRSDQKNGISVAEPSIGFIKGKVSIAYAMSAAQRNRADNNTNGHGNQASQVGFLALFDGTSLAPVGTALPNAAQYGRHNHSFVTTYGPNAEPALGVISGSSDGLKGGFLQLVPLADDGSVGKKDPLKMYKVSDYSDVANVQARGKRNPNDQAKGFINGVGGVPNPGFDGTGTKTNTFMPEVKTLSFTTITGYSGADAASKRLKDSIYLTLIPASWRAGTATTPGLPTDKPGTNPDGTGPAPKTSSPGVDPSGNAGEDQGGLGDGTDSPNAPSTTASGGCNVSSSGSSSTDGALVFLAIAGVIAGVRRKKSNSSEEV